MTIILPIVPVFNQQRKISFSLEKIKQAVDSAFSDYELIVVNDGSTDNTLTILRDITSTDPRIRVLSYTPNRGKGYEVRHGVLHSQGEAVMFSDADPDISTELNKGRMILLKADTWNVAITKSSSAYCASLLWWQFWSRGFSMMITCTLRQISVSKAIRLAFRLGDSQSNA